MISRQSARQAIHTKNAHECSSIGRINRNSCWEIDLHFSTEMSQENQRSSTVYNFETIDVDGKPEVTFKCLKRMVGERGFEPPTPWSRTRFGALWKSIEICSS